MAKYKYAHDEIKLCLNEIVEQVKVMPLELRRLSNVLSLRKNTAIHGGIH